VLSTSAAEHYRKVAEGNYAFIMGREVSDFETANNSDLIILSESISPDSLAFAMSNNSPFVRMVSNA
jgi:3,4-dihydroxy-2-butanone 4-phosphate synthase